MTTLLLIIAILLSLTQTNAQTCTQTYSNSASPDCTSLEKPYCVQTSAPQQPLVFTCVACLTDCDCDIGEYCSGDVWDGNAGTCKTFEAEGNDCVQMTTQNLYDYAITQYKCADVIAKGGEVVWVDGPRDGGNYLPTCIDGVCRACSPQGTFCYDGGMKAPRGCAYPGNIVGAYGYNWVPGEYYQNPTAVWLAIYFPFLIIGLITLCLILWKDKFHVFHY